MNIRKGEENTGKEYIIPVLSSLCQILICYVFFLSPCLLSLSPLPSFYNSNDDEQWNGR